MNQQKTDWTCTSNCFLPLWNASLYSSSSSRDLSLMICNGISNLLLPYMKRRALAMRTGSMEQLMDRYFSFRGLGISLRKWEQTTAQLALKDLWTCSERWGRSIPKRGERWRIPKQEGQYLGEILMGVATQPVKSEVREWKAEGPTEGLGGGQMRKFYSQQCPSVP